MLCFVHPGREVYFCYVNTLTALMYYKANRLTIKS